MVGGDVAVLLEWPGVASRNDFIWGDNLCPCTPEQTPPQHPHGAITCPRASAGVKLGEGGANASVVNRNNLQHRITTFQCADVLAKKLESLPCYCDE